MLFKYKKKNFQNYIIVILFIIASSNATSALSQSLVFHIASFLYTLFIFRKRAYSFGKNFYYLFGFLLFLFIIYFLKFGDPHPLFSFRMFLYATYAYLVVKLLGIKLYEILVKIVYKLTIVSLLLYLIQLINFQFIFSIIEKIQRSIPFLSRDNNEYANALIWGIQGRGAELRNCGFMWEPGAFAAILLIAIVFELTKNGFKLTKRTIVLTAGVLSTLSSMGFLGLIVIATWYLLNYKKKIYLLILLPIIVIYGLNLSFMKEKIVGEFERKDETIDLVSNSSKRDSYGRIGSFYMDLKDLQENPIFGIGGHGEAKTNYLLGNRTNGLSNYLLKFGILGFILLLLLSNKSFKKISNYYKVKNYYFYIVVLFILSFSNELLFTPLFLSFQFFALAYNEKAVNSNNKTSRMLI